MPATSSERKRMSQLRARKRLTPEQRAELAEYEARRGKPGRRPAQLGADVAAANDAPAPPLETTQVTDEQAPAAGEAPAADGPAASSSSSAPPLEVDDLGAGAEAAGAPPPPEDPAVAERRALCEKGADLAMVVMVKLEEPILEAGLFPVPRMLYPVIRSSWVVVLEKYLPQDMPEPPPELVVGGATAFQGVTALVARKRLKKREEDDKARVREPGAAANDNNSKPPPASSAAAKPSGQPTDQGQPRTAAPSEVESPPDFFGGAGAGGGEEPSS